jgi:hypothetical protein
MNLSAKQWRPAHTPAFPGGRKLAEYGVRGDHPTLPPRRLLTQTGGPFGGSRVIRPGSKESRSNFQQLAVPYSDLQTKFEARFVSPVPLYTATCG